MKLITVPFALVFVFATGICDFALADGFFIPEVRENLPDIPIQRAVVKYREGTETLIIESTLSGSGKHFGWIIPVPGEPLRFEKVSPGLLKTLSAQIGPKINHARLDRGLYGLPMSVFFAILVAIGCFAVVLWGKKGVFGFLLVFFLFVIGFPMFISYRAASPPGSIVDSLVEIKHRETVGNYEVFVLDARNSLEFDQWLKDSRFSTLPERALPIIDHYIEDGWYFVVAKLQTTGDGASTPHPVLLEFETDNPVYPMQLTALPDTNVHLEIFVIADKQAVPVNYTIQKEYCDYFNYNKFYARHSSDTEKGFVPSKIHGPGGEIAHADAKKVMWSGCVVTKFAGKISGSDMRDDMFFRFETPHYYRKQIYTAAARLKESIDNAARVIIFGLPVLTFLYRLTRARKYRFTLGSLFIISVIACASGFSLTYAAIGKTPEVHTIHRNWPDHLMGQLADLFSYPENTFETGAELSKILKKSDIKNPITNEPIILEDSPGNIILEEDADGTQIKLCLENGSLHDLF
ncbi:MAG: DUF2330 domain-containing protein [Desulfobacterales bacterium]|jgi:hypothetical protein